MENVCVWDQAFIGILYSVTGNNLKTAGLTGGGFFFNLTLPLAGWGDSDSVSSAHPLHQQCLPFHRYLLSGSVYQQCLPVYAGFHGRPSWLQRYLQQSVTPDLDFSFHVDGKVTIASVYPRLSTEIKDTPIGYAILWHRNKSFLSGLCFYHWHHGLTAQNTRSNWSALQDWQLF